MNKTKSWYFGKRILLLLSIVVVLAFAGILSACKQEPATKDERTIAVSDVTGRTIESALTIELQPDYQFIATVSGGEGKIEFLSSDTAVVDVKNSGLATVKAIGTATITAKIEDTNIKKEFVLQVVNAEIATQHKYKVAVDADRDTTFVLETDAANEGAAVQLKVGETLSGFYKFNKAGKVNVSLSELGMDTTGIYDVGVLLPNRADIRLASVGVSDVMQNYSFVANEGWRLSAGSVTPTFQNSTLAVNDGWGSVGMSVKLNNATKRYIRVTVKEGTAKWGIKLTAPSVYDTEYDLNLIDDRQAVAGEVVVADITKFADRMTDESLKYGGDYTVQLKLFAASSGGMQSVTIESIEMYGDDGEVREGVVAPLYAPSGEIKVDTHTANLQLGNTHKIKLRGDTSSFGFVFASSDESIAVVDSQGVVSGIASGDVKISIKSFDGTQEDEIDVKVYVAVNEIVTSRDVFKVAKSDSSFDLSENISVAPTNATSKELTYTITQGSDIATISDSGVLTWTASGSVKVKMTSTDPFKKSKEVEVQIMENYVSVTGMSLGEQANLTVQVDQEFVITPTFLPSDATDQAYTAEILTAGVVYEKPYSGAGKLFRGWGNGTGVIRFRSVANPAVYVDCNLTLYQDYVYNHDADSTKTHLYFSFSGVPDEALPESQTIQSTDTLKLEFYNNNTVVATYSQALGFANNALIKKSDITGLVDGTSYTLRARVMRGSEVIYGYWITNIEECALADNLMDGSWGGTDDALFYPTTDGSVKVGYDGGAATFYTMFDYDETEGGLLLIHVELQGSGTYAVKMGTDPYVDSVTFIPDGGSEGWFIFNLDWLNAQGGSNYLRFYLAQNGTILNVLDLAYYNGLTSLSKISF